VRRLALVAAVGVVEVALALALRVFRVTLVRRAVARCRSLARMMVTADDGRVVWAIDAVGGRMPGVSTCLVRALAADLLLAGDEQRGAVRIGVRRTTDGRLESHAWFERDGDILVGRAGAADYLPFVTLE
jgi:Transglutaminase-like superfamily